MSHQKFPTQSKLFSKLFHQTNFPHSNHNSKPHKLKIQLILSNHSYKALPNATWMFELSISKLLNFSIFFLQNFHLNQMLTRKYFVFSISFISFHFIFFYFHFLPNFLSNQTGPKCKIIFLLFQWWHGLPNKKLLSTLGTSHGLASCQSQNVTSLLVGQLASTYVLIVDFIIK